MKLIQTFSTKYPYYAYDDGRILKNNKKVLGYYTEPRYGTKEVMLTLDNGKRVHVNPAKLILDAYIGGFRSNRRVIYKDGNVNNLQISNLEWAHSFEESVIEEIDENNLDEVDLYIYRYYKSGNPLHIVEIVDKLKLGFSKIFSEKDSMFLYDDFLQHAKVELWKKLSNKEMQVIENSKSAKSYMWIMARGYILNYHKSQKLFNSQFELVDKFDDKKLFKRNYETNVQAETIGDEIHQMFLSYA